MGDSAEKGHAVYEAKLHGERFQDRSLRTVSGEHEVGVRATRHDPRQRAKHQVEPLLLDETPDAQHPPRHHLRGPQRRKGDSVLDHRSAPRERWLDGDDLLDGCPGNTGHPGAGAQQLGHRRDGPRSDALHPDVHGCDDRGGRCSLYDGPEIRAGVVGVDEIRLHLNQQSFHTLTLAGKQPGIPAGQGHDELRAVHSDAVARGDLRVAQLSGCQQGDLVAAVAQRGEQSIEQYLDSAHYGPRGVGDDQHLHLRSFRRIGRESMSGRYFPRRPSNQNLCDLGPTLTWRTIRSWVVRFCAVQAPNEDPTIPILLCIDVEPDPRLVDPNSQDDWVGFECAVELVDVLRPQLERATGRPARMSWFLRMDPQITHVYGSAGWAADRYRPQFDALIARGDEMGIHLHPWQWDRERAVWLQDFADQSWVTHCVESAFAAFEVAFGTTCRAFRFGDRWMNDESMALIERLGATSDSTIEPGRVGTETPDEYRGTFPDYSSVPRHPYRPSRQDFRSPGPRPLLDLFVIPVNSAPATWASTPPVGAAAVRVPNADYEGSLDATSVVEIAGWVWDRNHPQHSVDVEIVCDGELLATVGATRHREDLSDADKGDGKHAFRLATPIHLKDGSPHRICARVAGTNLELNASPRVLEGTAEPDTDTVTIYLDQHPLTFDLLVDRLLDEPTTSLLTLKVRSDFGIDVKRSSNVRINIEHLICHALAKRFEFMTVSEFVNVLAATSTAEDDRLWRFGRSA